jgi:23S rRNA pseudouridine2605 synthase
MQLEPQRLQKLLAQHGVGSRREMEACIVAGQVQVNGKTAVLGTKVTIEDYITVQGRPISNLETKRPRVILYNKPVGQICTRSDPQGRITVFSHLPRLRGQRWVGIGRLDINSSGLMLFTTEGELANQYMHPKANIEREYAVRVLGNVTDIIKRNITNGVQLDDDTFAKFTNVKFAGGKGSNTWYHVTLKQGRYREVRRIWESQGLQVSRLIRIRYGDIKLPENLPEGKFIELNYEDLRLNS